jgi:ribosomal protein L7/L12
MRKSFEQVREDYQKRVSQGEPRDDVIASLHADGLSIIESIKAVRTLYGVGLGDAKQIVTAHPVWAEVVRNTQPLHEKMIKVMMDAHDGLIDLPPE